MKKNINHHFKNATKELPIMSWTGTLVLIIDQIAMLDQQCKKYGMLFQEYNHMRSCNKPTCHLRKVHQQEVGYEQLATYVS